jgi:hypothetical protein
MHTSAQVMNNPADLINAAIEMLLAEHCELPAFSTLDRLARRIRTLVNGGIYQRILARLSDAEQQALSGLLGTEEAFPFTPFNRIKEAPKSATHMSHPEFRYRWRISGTKKRDQGIQDDSFGRIERSIRAKEPMREEENHVVAIPSNRSRTSRDRSRGPCGIP